MAGIVLLFPARPLSKHQIEKQKQFRLTEIADTASPEAQACERRKVQLLEDDAEHFAHANITRLLEM